RAIDHPAVISRRGHGWLQHQNCDTPQDLLSTVDRGRAMAPDSDAGARSEPRDGMTSIMSPPAATTATRPLVSSAPTGQRVASRRSVPERTGEFSMDKEFPPFRLDTTNQCLWRRRDSGDEERILLRPKSYAVLRYLVER